MTQKEISARCYQRRKENGLCPKCGKVLDRKGYYCKECLEKSKDYRNESRRFYRENGICTQCGKHKVPPAERTCPECRAKQQNRRENITEEQKIRNNESVKRHNNNTYRQRKEMGICTRCGKRKAIEGKAKCGICLAKDAEIHRLKKVSKQDIREYRVNHGLCYRCGEPLDRDGKMCEKCARECRKNLDKSREKCHWKSDNKLIFHND